MKTEWMDTLWAIMLFSFFLFLSLYVLSLIRYVVIDRERGLLIYWSLIRPWGRRFDLADCTGKFATTESSRYDYGFGVGHLVDGRHIRRVIYGTFYRNFDEMYDAIPLPEVKNGLRLWEYLLIATVGRIRVPKHWTEKPKRKPSKKHAQ